MKKYLDTSHLIRFSSGNNKGKIDWKSNIGKDVYFEYDDLCGTIKILDHITIKSKTSTKSYSRVTLQYEDKIITTSVTNLTQLTIPTFLNKNTNTKEYRYNVGDIIDKEMQSSTVIEQCKVNLKSKRKDETVRAYKLKCNFCKYEYITRENSMSSCPVCGIRSTYSERFICSMLKQANINFEVQKEFEWLQNRWYDIYLPDYNAVIEIQGVQHYEPIKLPDREHKDIVDVFKETIKIDKLKMDAAISNKINYYSIDVRNHENIFNNTKDVLYFIDFSCVSEFECEKFSIYNSVIHVCDLWNEGLSIEEISKQACKSPGTVQSKLRIGNKYNLCIYNKEANMKNRKVINPNKAS